MKTSGNEVLQLDLGWFKNKDGYPLEFAWLFSAALCSLSFKLIPRAQASPSLTATGSSPETDTAWSPLTDKVNRTGVTFS